MAQGSEDNQAKYLHDLNQYSLKVNLNCWFFEAFDEAWKGKEGPVGGKWGMFTAVRAAPPHEIIGSINTLIPCQRQPTSGGRALLRVRGRLLLILLACWRWDGVAACCWQGSEG